MRLGLFGGTFNPPHMGHIQAAQACADTLGLDALWLIPTGAPPHKALPPGSPTPRQRLMMVRLAAELIPGGAACDMEIKRDGPSYTVDTLRDIRRQRPGDSLWLIIGTDMLLSFERWREYRAIAGLTRLAVVSREAEDLPALREKARWLERDCGAGVDIIGNPVLEVTSTTARAGENVPLPQAVALYIVRHGLYGPEAVLNALRQIARARLSPRRFAHTAGTEAMAARLAALHGADVHAARIAALLHDITKELPIDHQLQMCRECGIVLSYPEDSLESVLHADSGALVAAREFGQGADICDAIRYHSTGRPCMSLLDKIIYVSDKIEETRTFSDVPPIRQQALYDLDGAVTAVLRGALEALHRQGKTPYGRTAEALSYMTKGK